MMTCVLPMNPIYNKHVGFNEEPGDFGGYNWIPNRLADCTCRIENHSTMCRKSVAKTGSYVDENKNEVEMKIEFDGIDRQNNKRKSGIDCDDLDNVPHKKIHKKSVDCVLEKPPTKRISPFLNTPKERKEERRKVLKITVQKLKLIDDPEHFLRRSVLINNTLKKVQKEIRDEKAKSYQGYKSAFYRSCDVSYLQWENQASAQFNNDDPLTKRLEEEDSCKLSNDSDNYNNNNNDIENKSDNIIMENLHEKSCADSHDSDIDTVFHSLIRVLDET
ncbi:uncharacterized protein [Mytilus edulis]|uniref:uncharacterized protein n=1 Tax=Mytilus edulis TaxID=6550 RepID=UPI0039F05250